MHQHWSCQGNWVLTPNFFSKFVFSTTMPFCTTKTWNFLVTHYFLWRNCRMCSSKILLLEFLFAFMFFTAAHFSLVAASTSHFLTAAMKFSRFSSNEIRLLCFFHCHHRRRNLRSLINSFCKLTGTATGSSRSTIPLNTCSKIPINYYWHAYEPIAYLGSFWNICSLRISICF